ncbi:MAG: cobalt/nickel transport system permease protein [Sulfurospirillum sp.]|jgi:cobalt/nickel transport system permease protein|nr:cobalt/nickel transport system permease protein [Sulfurospirillum sp.]DAB34950.1 MAG TPA: cobalamin biosynthesis protein CbiM [Sulfurospirillum sp. UBA12182]
MHISEGVLHPQLLVAGNVIATGVLYFSYKKLDVQKLPITAALSALFFIASFIHIPLGPTSVHLIMSGILGAFLGYGVFVAIFIALLLQALLFGYGGITVLGVNLLIIATPALIAYYLMRIKTKSGFKKLLLHFLIGSVPVSLCAVLLALVLALNGEAFYAVASLSLLSNLPIMLIEGIFVVLIFRFIQKVSPKLLEI